MLLERYRKVTPVREFAAQIYEAIQAQALGLHHAAVATLLPVLEGVLRKLAHADGRDIGQGTQKLVEEVDRLAISERQASPDPRDAAMERIEMIEQLRDFMRDRLLMKTHSYSGINNLNRHGILHGVFDGYGASSNFQKLISFLDGLVFFTGFRTPGVSCFAPDDTIESRQLAQYLSGLSACQPLRPKI